MWVSVVADFAGRLRVGSEASNPVLLSAGSEFPRRVSGPCASIRWPPASWQRPIAQIAGEAIEQESEAEVVAEPPLHHCARVNYARVVTGKRDPDAWE